jgi:hypothetical protein
VARAYAGHTADRRSAIEIYTYVEFDDLVAAYERLFGSR